MKLSKNKSAEPTNVWIDVHEERQSLLLLLETLTQSEWDEPSLCAGWRVRDVVGHMVSETTMTLPGVVKGMVGSRISNQPIHRSGCSRTWSPSGPRSHRRFPDRDPPRELTCVDFRRYQCLRTSSFTRLISGDHSTELTPSPKGE